MALAYFSTSSAINISRPEWGEFSGTGPFLVDESLLPQIYAELDAAGVTVTRWNVYECLIPEDSDVAEWPVMNPRTQIVVSGVNLIPISNLVGATDNYDTYQLLCISTTPATVATVASWANTSGTALAYVKQALTMSTVASAATVAADYRLSLKKGTTGSGLDNPHMLLQILYYEP